MKVPYDISKRNIPYFQTTWTLEFDTCSDENSGIANLSSMKEKYNFVPKNVPNLMTKRVNTDHGDMLTHADGYITAWLWFGFKMIYMLKKHFMVQMLKFYQIQTGLILQKNLRIDNIFLLIFNKLKKSKWL